MKNSFRPLQRKVDCCDAAFLDFLFLLLSGPSTHARSAIAIFCAWRTASAPAICHLPPHPRHRARRDALRTLPHGGSERRTVVATNLAGVDRFGRRRTGAPIPVLGLAEPRKDGRRHC